MLTIPMKMDKMAVLQVQTSVFRVAYHLIHHLGGFGQRKSHSVMSFNVLPLLSIHLHPQGRPIPRAAPPGWRPADVVMNLPWPNTVDFIAVGYGVEHLLRQQRFCLVLYEWRLAPRELVVCNAVKGRFFSSSLMTAKESLSKGSLW